MASVVALLDEDAFKKYAKQATLGAVLPIDGYQTDDRSFATELSHGGALYLVVVRPTGELWLVAVLEEPETSGLKKADKRKPGWYAAVNTTPVTDISKLRGKLKLARAFCAPRILTKKHDGAMREALDEVDAPVQAGVETVARIAELDPKQPPLERAVTYLGSGHVEQAIEAMCESWRASRAPMVADLIDRATRLTPAYHRPLFDQRQRYDQNHASKIWKAAFEADAQAAMPQLLLNLGIGGYSVISERMKLLGTLPLDPRIGARAIELLASRPRRAEEDRWWWPPIAELLLKSNDTRTFESLLDLERMEEGIGAATGKLYAMARTAPPKLPSADTPLVTKLEAELHRLEAPLRTECDLVDQIAAHPDDDGPYLVYADWLIEHDRPLGEFITLTCQARSGKLSPAHVRRFTHLQEMPYLCGVFDDFPATRLRKRERGVDRELSVYCSTQPRSWRMLARSPLVRALDRLRLVGHPWKGRAEAISEMIAAAPALQRVEEIGETTGNEVAKLLGGTFELRVPKLSAAEREQAESEGRPVDHYLERVTRAGRSR